MTEKSGETNSAGSGDIVRDLYTTHVTKGQQVGGAVGASLVMPLVAVPALFLVVASKSAPGDV
jgi:hypothetical protein